MNRDRDFFSINRAALAHIQHKTLSLWASVSPSHCGGYVCLDVGQMSRYWICIRLKSTFGSGQDQMRKI